MAETVNVDGRELKVTNIHREDLREVVGIVPLNISVDRLYRWEGIIVGETYLCDRGVVIEVHYELDEESVDPYMEAHEISNPSAVDEAEEVLWERDSSAEKELSTLVHEGGLSAAEALDFWSVEIRGKTASQWAEYRRTSHQAVSENVRKARQKLKE